MALLGWRGCTQQLQSNLSLSLPGPCWSLGSLSDRGGKAAPLRRSSCGSLQSHAAPLAGASAGSLMPPRNGHTPSFLWASLLRGSDLARLLCLHLCYFRAGKGWMRKKNNNDAVFLSKFRDLKFWLQNLCLEIWAQIMNWANTVPYCNSVFGFKWGQAKGFLHLKLQYSENESPLQDAYYEETARMTFCQEIISSNKNT